jgi:gluconate 5-dehydrogenase
VLLAARREDVLKEAAARLNAECGGPEVQYRTVDLADRTSIATFADAALEALGRVDILLGNAALGIYQPIDTISDESFDAMMQVNVSANISLVRAFLPGMRANRWGRVIFSSSAVSTLSSPHEGSSLYTTVKAALQAFTRTAAAEAGHDGITVNSLVLGMFMTDLVVEMAAGVDPEHGGREFLKPFASITSLGRMGRCEEVEGIVQLLASDAGTFITGASLPIDGGMTTMLLPHEPPSGDTPTTNSGAPA